MRRLGVLTVVAVITATAFASPASATTPFGDCTNAAPVGAGAGPPRGFQEFTSLQVTTGPSCSMEVPALVCSLVATCDVHIRVDAPAGYVQASVGALYADGSQATGHCNAEVVAPGMEAVGVREFSGCLMSFLIGTVLEFTCSMAGYVAVAPVLTCSVEQ